MATGYTFGGWYTDSACRNAFNFNTPITKNTTLYAKWTANSNSGGKKTPRTGDGTPIGLWIILAAVAAAAVIGIVTRKKIRN